MDWKLGETVRFIHYELRAATKSEIEVVMADPATPENVKKALGARMKKRLSRPTEKLGVIVEIVEPGSIPSLFKSRRKEPKPNRTYVVEVPNDSKSGGARRYWPHWKTLYAPYKGKRLDYKPMLVRLMF